MVEAQEQAEGQSPRELFNQIATLVRKALRRRIVLAVTFALGLLAFFFVPTIITPVYISETLLVYREGIETEQLLGEETQRERPRQRNLRLREMLLSRSNFANIITELELYPDTVQSKGIQTAVDELRKNTKCTVGEGDTFAILYRGDEPEVVYQVTKRLGQSLIESSQRYRLEQAQATSKFLEAQDKKITKELAEKEQELAQFLALHPEFAQDVTQGAPTTGASVRAAERRLAGGNSSLDALERQAARIRARVNAPAGAPVMAPATDPDYEAKLSAAQQELARAEQDLAEKRSRYTQQHPDVKAADARARAARSKLAMLRTQVPVVAAAPPSTDEERARLRKQLSRLDNAIARAKGAEDAPTEVASQGNEIVALETEWTALNREVADVRSRNQEIQTRLFRSSIYAKVVASGQSSQMAIRDEAYMPNRPTKRGKRRTGAVATMVVWFLGGLMALGLALLDDRLYNEADIRRLGVGPLAHVTPGLPRPPKGKSHV